MAEPGSSAAHTAPRNIDWDAQPLGMESDTALARRIGVSSTAVARARKARGIQGTDGRNWRKPMLFDHPLLGTMADAELAQRLGVNKKTVQAARHRRGIAPFGTKDWPVVDWSKVPLDSRCSDKELADALGVDSKTVWTERRRRGVSREHQITCPCGVTFTSTNVRQVWCSESCCGYAHQLVRKGRIKNEETRDLHMQLLRLKEDIRNTRREAIRARIMEEHTGTHG